MRIRRKKWAKEELEKAEFYIDNPEIFRNKWNEKFKNDNPLHIELGCGKGLFIASLASKHKDINYIAVDMIEAMLGLSKRNIEEAYKEQNYDNIYLIRANVERIFEVFGEKDKVERIYINFCNPWPKGKHKKRRLTHPRQLENYKKILKEDGEIYFKESGFEIIKTTYNLHEDMIFEENIVTEHEKMFSDQGIKIKAVIVKKI